MARKHRKRAQGDNEKRGRRRGGSRDEAFLGQKGVRKDEGGHARMGGDAPHGRRFGGGFRGASEGGSVDFDAVLLGRWREEELVAAARRTDERLRAMLRPAGAPPNADAGASAASAASAALNATSAPSPRFAGSAADTAGTAGATGVAGADAPVRKKAGILPGLGSRGFVGPIGDLQPSRSYLGKAPVRPTRDELMKKVEEKKALPAEPKLSSLFGTTKATPTYTEGGLKLDPWQAEALDALLAGANVVVDAPTSAGKTRVIEALLEHKMKEGIKLVYTSPVKSLSNDKYREFTERYGKDKVGINTGDFKENLAAPIMLATLETYRNSLLGVEPNMNRRIVVYDEYHYLQDESRGSAWEESIILTPKESQLVLLSASVPNAEDFANWIEALYAKPCKVIRVSERPVPLVDVVYTRWGWILADELNLAGEEVARLRKMLRGQKTRRFLRQKEEIADLLVPVTRALERSLGPVVVYAGRRASVEACAQAFAKHLRGEFRGPEADKLHDRIKDLPGWDYVPSELQRLVRKYGIAYHHSGMIPPGRVAIETLLKEGLLRLCTGTMGISLGVNFAVRSAVISDETRPSEGGETKYSNSEILQMLGRAGRRGHDTQGFSLWPNPGRYADQRPREREACTSSLKFDPTTVLGILGQHEDLAYLSEFYRRSFFMRGKDPALVLVEDHERLSGLLYSKYGHAKIACDDIPPTFRRFQAGGKNRERVPCLQCPARLDCHLLTAQAQGSTLNRIVRHLSSVGALDGSKPSKLGQLARHFPQAGGLIVASWLASGRYGADNFRELMQAMAVFCAAHFKDIADTYADVDRLRDLQVPKLVDRFYPEDLFPELWDDPPARGGYREEGRVFREANMAAPSLVSSWLDLHMSWDQLVEAHASKYFSAGDCMMVLFRFSTFLQSCARLGDFDPALAAIARDTLKVLLRDPLDARNRMLLDDEPETPEVNEATPPSASVTTEGSGAVEPEMAEAEASASARTITPAPVKASPRVKPAERPAGDAATTASSAAESTDAPASAPSAVAVPEAPAALPARRKLSLFRARRSDG